MARKLRAATVAPGAPNHVLLRGNNRRNLFSYPCDRSAFIRVLSQALDTTCTALHCAALMKNHIHLMLSPPSSEALSVCIKSASQRYARYRNLRTRGTGKVFEQRFRCSPISDDAHLAIATLYIDLNPVVAGLSARQYRWSTLGLHANEQQCDRHLASLWTPSGWYASLGSTLVGRSLAYRRWIDDYLQWHEPLQHLYRLEHHPRPDSRRLERPNRTRAR